MLSIKTRNIMAEYLINYINSQKSLQNYRTNLVSCSNFDGVKLFQYLDKKNKGLITYLNLQELLQISDPYFLKLVFQRIDSRCLGGVTLHQFKSYLLPRLNDKLRSDIIQKIGLKSQEQQNLPEQINFLKDIISKILLDELSTLNKIRQQLSQAKDVSIEGIMKVLDRKNKGFINQQDLEQYLKSHGKSVVLSQMPLIIQNFDKKYDGKIYNDSLYGLFCITFLKNKTQSKKSNMIFKTNNKREYPSDINKAYPSGRQCLCNKQFIQGQENKFQYQSLKKQKKTNQSSEPTIIKNNSNISEQNLKKMNKEDYILLDEKTRNIQTNKKISQRSSSINLRRKVQKIELKQNGVIKRGQLKSRKYSDRNIEVKSARRIEIKQIRNGCSLSSFQFQNLVEHSKQTKLQIKYEKKKKTMNQNPITFSLNFTSKKNENIRNQNNEALFVSTGRKIKHSEIPRFIKQDQ